MLDGILAPKRPKGVGNGGQNGPKVSGKKWPNGPKVSGMEAKTALWRQPRGKFCPARHKPPFLQKRPKGVGIETAQRCRYQNAKRPKGVGIGCLAKKCVWGEEKADYGRFHEKTAQRCRYCSEHSWDLFRSENGPKVSVLAAEFESTGRRFSAPTGSKKVHSYKPFFFLLEPVSLNP